MKEGIIEMKTTKEFYSIATVATLALMISQTALADVTAVYKMTSANGNGSQTIKYVDNQHIRVDMSNRKVTLSMLKLGDKIYSITGKVVQDMDQLAQLMAAMGKGKKSKHKTAKPIKYKDTGKTETIAGIKGKVYRFTERGKQHEVVLGKHKGLQDAVQGLIKITQSATGMMPDNGLKSIQQDTLLKSLALLRLDNKVRLKSISTKSIPKSTFKLPSKPQQMGGIGNLMKEMLGH